MILLAGYMQWGWGIFYADELCQTCNDVEGIKLRKAETAAVGQLWGNNLHVITAYSYLIVLGFANRAEWQYEKSSNCFGGNKANVFFFLHYECWMII